MAKRLLDKRLLILVAILPAVLYVAFNPQEVEAGGGAMDPIYTVTELDVYESSTDTLDDGTVVCQDVTITTGGTCSGTLNGGSTYQFEFTVTNGPDGNGTPNNMEFRSTVASGDVVGTSPTLGNGGCGVQNNWTMSIVTTRVDGNSGTTCTIAKNSSEEFWMIITLDNDVCDGTATATFFIDDGSFNDESGTITFNCASASSPVINIDQYDIYESESTTLGSGVPICTAVDADTAGQNCNGSLIVGHTYRIEIEVDESAGNNFTPTSFDLDVAVGDFDVLGDMDGVGSVGDWVLNSGCEDHTDWTESFVGGTDVRSTAGTTTNCVINSGADPTDEFWIIIRIHSSAGTGGGAISPALTFTVTDGSNPNTSESQTISVINILE